MYKFSLLSTRAVCILCVFSSAFDLTEIEDLEARSEEIEVNNSIAEEKKAQRAEQRATREALLAAQEA